MDPAHILFYPEHYIQTPDLHPMDYLAGEITARGWGNLHAGVEMDNYYYTAADHGALVQSCPMPGFMMRLLWSIDAAPSNQRPN